MRNVCCDNVLPVQGYRAYHWAVMGKYGAMVEWCLAEETEESEKVNFSTISYTINLIWNHAGMDQGFLDDRLLSILQSYGIVTLAALILLNVLTTFRKEIWKII